MPEASVALCVGLLGAKAWGALQQHRGLRSALARAKQGVQVVHQQLAAAAPRREQQQERAGGAASARERQQPPQQQQQQQRTPTAAGAAAPAAAAAPQVSPLIQRGERPQTRTAPPCFVTPAPADPPVANLNAAPLLPAAAVSGLVLNEETGHIIGIGKGTYNRLSKRCAAPRPAGYSACVISVDPADDGTNAAVTCIVAALPRSLPPCPQSMRGTSWIRWRAPSRPRRSRPWPRLGRRGRRRAAAAAARRDGATLPEHGGASLFPQPLRDPCK